MKIIYYCMKTPFLMICVKDDLANSFNDKWEDDDEWGLQEDDSYNL